MKYIVIWVVMVWVNDPCGESFGYNDYGIKINISCSVIHGHHEQSTDTLFRVFTNKDSAKMFYQRGIEMQNSPFKGPHDYPAMLKIIE